ncbi:MAG: DNA polymerase III subunit epsilon, partial [Pseudomonadota bacterium]|nr:DNA polymerase III subunit epsilon [Pseudomonadota bacterium]
TEAYLALTSGQEEIGFASEPVAVAQTVVNAVNLDAAARPRVRVDSEEAAAHEARLQALQGKSGRCLWLQMEAATCAGS